MRLNINKRQARFYSIINDLTRPCRNAIRVEKLRNNGEMSSNNTFDYCALYARRSNAGKCSACGVKESLKSSICANAFVVFRDKFSASMTGRKRNCGNYYQTS